MREGQKEVKEAKEKAINSGIQLLKIIIIRKARWPKRVPNPRCSKEGTCSIAKLLQTGSKIIFD